MNTNRRAFLKLTAAGTALGALPASPLQAAEGGPEPTLTADHFSTPGKYPNIVLIMTDQQRADVCKREGFELDTTPFLDKLAAQGVWFNKAYTSAPACVPARISMLTGRYPNSTQVRSNHNARDVVCSASLVDVLKHRNYKTALVGKNHTYLRRSDLDGWKEFGHCNSFDANESDEKKAFEKWMRSLSYHLSTEPTPFGVEMQYPYRIVSESQKWIESVQDQPFFLWMSFPEPHNPYQVPEPYWNLFEPETLPPVRAGKETVRKKGYSYVKCKEISELGAGDIDGQMPRIRSNYYGMLRLLDDQVKRFVTWLEQRGLMGNTILIYVSDHGDYVGEYGMTHKGAGTPEALMRIPFFWVGKGIPAQPQAHAAHVSMVDILPTICQIVGVDIPRGVQGRSLWPLLSGKEYPKEEFSAVYAEQGFGGLYFNDDDPQTPQQEGCIGGGLGAGGFDELNTWTQCGSRRMLRKDDWKLEYDMAGNGTLYHLGRDPSEIDNLWDDPKYSDVKNQLLAELLKRTIRYQDDIPYPRNRYYFKREIHNYSELDEIQEPTFSYSRESNR